MRIIRGLIVRMKGIIKRFKGKIFEKMHRSYMTYVLNEIGASE